MPDEIKLCEDCRFFQLEENCPSASRCGHLQATEQHIAYQVTRALAAATAQRYCTVMRVSVCGPTAKLFEPKPGVGGGES